MEGQTRRTGRGQLGRSGVAGTSCSVVTACRGGGESECGARRADDQLAVGRCAGSATGDAAGAGGPAQLELGRGRSGRAGAEHAAAAAREGSVPPAQRAARRGLLGTWPARGGAGAAPMKEEGGAWAAC